MLSRAKELAEVNPMMGHRGVRLGITSPEIYELHSKDVFEATVELVNKKLNAKPQIMIHKLSSISEINHNKQI